VAVQVHLAADGSARAEVTERLRGAWAISWREMLRQIDPANLEREFESYVGRQVTAASLTSLRIEGQDDLDADIVLRYAFTAPSVATPVDGQPQALSFEGMYLAELSPAYASLPRRSTTLYNSEALNASLDLSVALPAGARVAELPPSRNGAGPGVRWEARFERARDGFRFTRSVQIPPRRFTPEDYAAFAAQVRALDTIDTQRVLVQTR
jgi:hypothetical protein